MYLPTNINGDPTPSPPPDCQLFSLAIHKSLNPKPCTKQHSKLLKHATTSQCIKQEPKCMPSSELRWMYDKCIKQFFYYRSAQ